MSTLRIEFYKQKRTGVILLMVLLGIVGAFYVILNFILRKDFILNLPLAPMDILITTAYGMVMVLNMFGIIVAACVMYNVEFKGNALKKIFTLPIGMSAIYLSKLLILSLLFLFVILSQTIAFMLLGTNFLPMGTFDFGSMLHFSLYAYITSLAVVAFMLFVASAFENMWMPLGTGVGGFLTGMALTTLNPDIILVHPFVVILKPAVAMSIIPDIKIISMSVIHILFWNGMGLWFSKNKSLE